MLKHFGHEIQRQIRLFLLGILLILSMASFSLAAEVAGCDTSAPLQTITTSAEFETLTLSNVDFHDAAGDPLDYLFLEPVESFNANNLTIEVPFDQELSVRFLYEDAGYTNTLGWMLYEDAIDDAGNFLGWANIPSAKKHVLFEKAEDCCGGGDGIFNTVNGTDQASLTEAYLLSQGFYVDDDGLVSTKDMRKKLFLYPDNPTADQIFPAGTELVFWLANNSGAWQNDCGGDSDEDCTPNVFFTKKEWNPDTFGCDTGLRYYDLAAGSSGGDCNNNKSAASAKGLLDAGAISRLNDNYGFTMSGIQSVDVTNDEKFPHAIVAAPDNDPNQWILSWEDLSGGGDLDYNDITFHIERQAGGLINSSSAPTTPANANAFYTSVTFGVYEEIPTDAKCSDTSSQYKVSVNGDDDASYIPNPGWIGRFDSDAMPWPANQSWAFTVAADGALTVDYDSGPIARLSVGKVYREITIDFVGQNLSGRELVWKSLLKSPENGCEPKIYGISLQPQTKTHARWSRSSPIMVGNVVYSGGYETPDVDWAAYEQNSLRGYLDTERLYDPIDPSVTSTLLLSESGVQLAAQSPSATAVARRKIYSPARVLSISLSSDSDSFLTLPDAATGGDGVTTDFAGILPYVPVMAGSVSIKAGGEEFYETVNNKLESTFGGSGEINRFTGEFTLIFNSSPADLVPITADYQYYVLSYEMTEFVPDNVNLEMMALDPTVIKVDTGEYLYDFNQDASVDEDDADWLVEWVRGYRDWDVANQNWLLDDAWKLLAIDHSTPAVLTVPGYPVWYFGSDITVDEQQSYDVFVDSFKPPGFATPEEYFDWRTDVDNGERPSVLFVGSRGGMIHAFDVGRFRSGDNPETPLAQVEEKRGYFAWQDLDSNSATPIEPNYGTGKELWSFIPANLLGRFKDGKAWVDASPTIADVRINSDCPGCVSVNDCLSGILVNEQCINEWRSVLLSAEGNGGDTVFALDVTDPLDPTFLWEFSDSGLYRSQSSPAVGQIGRMMIDGETRWVAFFVSGHKSDNGPSIFMIDISDGSLVMKIPLVDDLFPNLADAVPSGQPAIVDSDGNGYLDRFYIGTDKGYLVKVNMPDDPRLDWSEDQISSLVINADFDLDDDDVNEILPPQQFNPIYASPTVVTTKSYVNGQIQHQSRILFGTSDSPYAKDEDPDKVYHFFAYVDTAPKTSLDYDGSVDASQVSLDWFKELPAGHKVFAAAFANAGKIYFGTVTADTEDPCGDLDANEGHLYAMDLDGSDVDNPTWVDTGDVMTSPLVEDEHLFVRTVDGLKMYGSGSWNNDVQVTGEGKSKPVAWREITY